LTVFSFGLTWDSLGLATKVIEPLVKRNMTNKKGEKLYGHNMVMGFNEGFKESAFIVEGFDYKNKWGIVITIPNKKQEITIMGGAFNKEASMSAKFNKTFTDLSKASKYFEEALSDYDGERND